METILRVIQVLLAIGLIGVVLLQRSEGGGLGIGSSGGMGSFMSVRGTANFLTRVTSILGGLFMVTCLALALIAHPAEAPRSIFDVPASTQTMPAPPASEAPPSPAPTSGEQPSQSGAPTSSAPVTGAAPPVVATPMTEIPAQPIETVTPTPPVPPSPATAPTMAAPTAPAHKAKKTAHHGASKPTNQ